MRALQESSGDAAPIVELFQRYHVDMGCELEDAVRRGVDDRGAGSEVLFPRLSDDSGSGGGFVAQHLSSDRSPERLYDLRGNPSA